jgi:hypothetical protein
MSLAHLGIQGRRSGKARRVRVQLDGLAVAGALQVGRGHGTPTWTLDRRNRATVGLPMQARMASAVALEPT